MICTDTQAPIFLLFSNSVPELVYYSHIPTAIIAIIMGFFVFSKSKKLDSRLLFFISIIFFLLNFLNLIMWTNINSDIVMFFWTVSGMIEAIFLSAIFYFVYVFIKKRDIDFKYKLLWSIFLLPFLVFNYNSATNFNLVGCETIQKDIFVYYIYIFELLVFFGIFIFSFLHCRKEKNTEFKKQAILFTIGIELFLGMFITSGLIANMLYEKGISYAFQVEQYGLFGMPIFLGFLSYLIVRYKAFNIKLIGAQALVVALNLLIASQFFFIQSEINIVLTGITLSISLGFGYILIKSVKKEVQQKEELQKLTHSLEKANAQLKKLDTAKTEFISIASHQLRTPITAIKGFSSLVLEGSYGEISESVQGAMEKIYSSSQRLVDLIEDLLNVSRIESGRMQFNFELGNVEKILSELYENFILVAKTKKFYLDYKHPETPLPEIMMDAGKVRELVSNFIDNALKYTEKGGVTIRAEIRDAGVVIDENGFVIAGKISQFGKVVRITVSDTGIGIPKEEIPYLFKKFSRGKDVSRLHVGGTGLGLYVGKAIAEAHHGEVWVESGGAGMGSRFIIEIPIKHEG